MAAIRGIDTKPELVIQRGLHARGFRYRLHDRKLPGRPDMVFPKYKAVIFVNGCFWHGHGCALFKWPRSREEFWRAKIEGNLERDKRNASQLCATGWRVGIVWECALKGKLRLPHTDVLACLSEWLLSDLPLCSIEGSDYKTTDTRA